MAVLIRLPAPERSAPERAALHAHLAGCEACRTLEARSRALDDSLEPLASAPIPGETLASLDRRMEALLAGGLAPRARAATGGVAGLWSGWMERPGAWRWASAAAVPLVLAIVLLVGSRSPGLEVELLEGGRVRGTAGDGGTAPQYRPGDPMRVRVEAERDGVVYLYAWSAGAGLAPLAIDGTEGFRLRAGMPLVLPPEVSQPLEVSGEGGEEALIVLSCSGELEAARRDRIVGERLELRGAVGAGAQERLEAVSGCRAAVAPFEILAGR